jgi:hypothetical protein
LTLVFYCQKIGVLRQRGFEPQKVSEACPVYNCHGLTFANRRTSVPQTVLPILEDDGFNQVSEKEARVGDIVLYVSPRGDVVHSGFVVRCDSVEIVAGSKSVVPVIWSKWGKGYEMVHPVGECPYLEDEGSGTQYYRLLRWKPS